MINAILTGVIKLIISLVNVLLLPIDLLISNALPDLATAISAIGTFLNLCCSSIGWVLSVFGLSSECISLIVLYYGFKLTLPLAVSLVKLAIKWYNALKL